MWKFERNWRTTQRTYKAAKSVSEGLTKGSQGPQHELLLGVVVERNIQDSFPYRVRHFISCGRNWWSLPTCDITFEWARQRERKLAARSNKNKNNSNFELMVFSSSYPRMREDWLTLGYEWPRKLLLECNVKAFMFASVTLLPCNMCSISFFAPLYVLTRPWLLTVRCKFKA